MPGGGKLRVATERMVRRKGGLDLEAPRRVRRVIVADSGPGTFPPADRERSRAASPPRDEGQGESRGLGLAVRLRDRQKAPRTAGSRRTAGRGRRWKFRVYLPCCHSAS